MNPMHPGTPEDILRRLLDAALRAADPREFLPDRLPDLLPEWFASGVSRPSGRLVVLGAGKAAASMACAIEAALPADVVVSGVVVTRAGYALPCRMIEVLEAAHPVPDGSSMEAARRLQGAVRLLTRDDTVLVLISGGASALLASPREGLSLDDKRTLCRHLLTSGARIQDINCVRRHLSTIKGGQLARQCHPARVVTLALSDVAGDEPTAIGSGLTVADPTTCADALAVVERFGIPLPLPVRRALESGAWETPKPGDAALAGGEFHLVGSATRMLCAAAEAAQQLGLAALVLGDRIEGEAREVARVMAGIARSCGASGLPLAPPCVVLSGGETTVTVRGAGRGGRNTEFTLAMAAALAGEPGIAVLAADTDGIDGTEDNAGALYLPERWRPVMARTAAQALDNNDSYAWFRCHGDLVVTGPTRTNVNDFRAVLVFPAAT